MQVSARTWCRVDFAGGTLDIWPLGMLHPGSVTVNLAIDIATEVDLRPNLDNANQYRLVAGDDVRTTSDLKDWLEDPATALAGNLAAGLGLGPLEIEIRSRSPRGGGLGGSSAIAVAFLVAAEKYANLPEGSLNARSRFVRDVEARMMGLPTGRQDNLPALCGGLLAVEHELGGVRVERLDSDLDAIGESLIVAYSGQSHFSAGNNWRIIRRRLDGDAEVVRCFEEIARIGRETAAAFRAGSLESVGKLMSEEWFYRRQLAEGISTPKIEAMLSTAIDHGAWGGKACGAGGGGCVAILAPLERRSEVEAALAEVSEILPARPCSDPFEVRSE